MGCGLSDKPQAYSYTLSQHINNLEALLDTLKLERLTLFLHDWGGPIGMGYAPPHSEPVKRVIVFETASLPSSPISVPDIPCNPPDFSTLSDTGADPFGGVASTNAL